MPFSTRHLPGSFCALLASAALIGCGGKGFLSSNGPESPAQTTVVDGTKALNTEPDYVRELIRQYFERLNDGDTEAILKDHVKYDSSAVKPPDPTKRNVNQEYQQRLLALAAKYKGKLSMGSYKIESLIPPAGGNPFFKVTVEVKNGATKSQTFDVMARIVSRQGVQGLDMEYDRKQGPFSWNISAQETKVAKLV